MGAAACLHKMRCSSRLLHLGAPPFAEGTPSDDSSSAAQKLLHLWQHLAAAACDAFECCHRLLDIHATLDPETHCIQIASCKSCEQQRFAEELE